MGHHDALHQWCSADPRGFLGRYQLDSTYQPQYGRVVVAVASELAFDLEEKTNSILTVLMYCYDKTLAAKHIILYRNIHTVLICLTLR